MAGSSKKELNIWFDKFKAVRVSAANIERVAEWLGGDIVKKADEETLALVPTSRGDIAVRYGDYVAKDVDDRYRVVRIFGLDLDGEIAKHEFADRVDASSKN